MQELKYEKIQLKTTYLKYIFKMLYLNNIL